MTETQEKSKRVSEAFDFSDMTVTTKPLVKGAGRPKKYQTNPFLPFLLESKQDNEGRSVTLPQPKINDAVRLLRGAAVELGYGVAIRLYDSGGRQIIAKDVKALPKNAMVRIDFQATVRRKYVRDDTPAE